MKVNIYDCDNSKELFEDILSNYQLLKNCNAIINIPNSINIEDYVYYRIFKNNSIFLNMYSHSFVTEYIGKNEIEKTVINDVQNKNKFCFDCYKCKKCEMCIECKTCENCFQSMLCKDSKKVKSCLRCSTCSNCDRCEDCDFCDNCNECYNCKTCMNCLNCNNCNQCMNITDSENQNEIIN